MDNADVASAKPGWIQIILVGRRPKTTLMRILVLAVACYVVFNFALWPIQVNGISMEPTYHDHGINCVNRLSYLFHAPKRGDVVSICFAEPARFTKPSELLMKRIIGLPGESVAFHQGHVYINGKILNEPYLTLPCTWEHAPILCGPDQYYVVGDNRSMPFEYHTQGRAERNLIAGKVLL